MKQFFTLMMILIASIAASAQVKEINSLSDIPKNGRPYIVKAYANWCGPCRYYTPVFEEAAEMYKGQIDFYMINIDNDAAKGFVKKYNVTSIPRTILFLNKTKNYSISGAQSLEDLLDFIQSKTGKKPRNK